MNHLNQLKEIQQSDGAKWRYMKTENLEVYLTAAAKDFFIRNKGLFTDVGDDNLQPVTKHTLRTMRNINKLLSEGKEKTEIPELEFIADGQNADFFRIQGTKVGLRELKINGDTLDPTIEKLKRMDTIQGIMESGEVPRWIHIPIHFGAILTPGTAKKRREFLLMEVIDHGVTGEDLKRAAKGEPERFPGANEQVIKEFGSENLADLLITMESQIDEALDILQNACSKHRENFRQLFTDFNRKNILIQKLVPPVGGKEMGFWIIDQ